MMVIEKEFYQQKNQQLNYQSTHDTDNNNTHMEEQEQIQQLNFTSPKLFYDEQGFVKSFDINSFDPKQVQQFFNCYGVVVFDNMITQQQIQKSIDDLWDDIKQRYGNHIDKNNSQTWQFQKGLHYFGFVNSAPISKPQFWLNRQNQNIYKAFKTIYTLSSGKQLKEPMIAIFDRGSVLRPAKINPAWETQNLYHFDINPWWWTGVVKTDRKDWNHRNNYIPQKFVKWLSEGNYLPNIGYKKLAGVLAFSDTNEESGGFQCVCGFQKYIKEWTLKHPPKTQLTSDEILMKNFQKIYQRKGSLMIFTRQLPHNIYKNKSQNFRYAQYLRYAPQSTLMLTELQKQRRKQCVQLFLPKYLDIDNPISKQIYMLK